MMNREILKTKEYCIKFRNIITRSLYKGILKPIFFLNDPESVHDHIISFGKMLGAHSISKKVVSLIFNYSHHALEQDILGIHFQNPIGLAAGFDKDAELPGLLSSVGFGFVEIGSVTGNPCLGNPKPRLWRLKKSKGLVVYYGLKNKGCEVIAEKLKDKKCGLPLGTSVAMTNCKENLNIENAVLDYKKAFSAFKNIGDYTTINISCPNAEGGQPFIKASSLNYLLDVLDGVATNKPIFIKISPDLSWQEIDDLLEVAESHRVSGIICSNLTKKRNNKNIIDKEVPEKGGVSGKVVQNLSDELLSYIYKKKKRFVLIGCGGVFSAEDAYKKIKLGASLVQMVTGMIFEGPQIVSEINQGLVQLLKKDGYNTINEAIGTENC